MDNKKEKIEEPYSPDNTPNPPQIIDPNRREETPGSEPVKAKKNPSAESEDRKKKDQPAQPEKKGKLLNEDAQINDETTI
jgi:hypothetical protein